MYKTSENQPQHSTPTPTVQSQHQHALSEEMVARYLARKPNFLKRWFKDNAPNDLLQECIKIKEQKEYLTKPRTSLTHEMFNNIVQGNRSNQDSSLSSFQAVDYMNLNDNELFFELIRDIANELNVDVVCHKILTNVSILTNSDRGSLFLARGPKDSRYLVSKLFDVTAGSTLEQSLHKEDQQIIIPFGKGIAGHVASTKEYINIPDAYEVNIYYLRDFFYGDILYYKIIFSRK
jgi:hypothetical protein